MNDTRKIVLKRYCQLKGFTLHQVRIVLKKSTKAERKLYWREIMSVVNHPELYETITEA